jgi:hypothetical protein
MSRSRRYHRIEVRRRIVIGIGLLLALPLHAAGQVRASELQETVAALFRVAESVPPILKPPGLTPAVTWMISNIEKSDPSAVSQEYLESLRRAADLLKGSRDQRLILDVTSELEAKVEHCRVLGVGMGGSVLMRVNTRRHAQSVGDWQVQYLLKIYEHIASATPLTFPRLSTPTETRVEPGRYWVWARDPATGRTSERVLVRVVGQPELAVDLFVP